MKRLPLVLIMVLSMAVSPAAAQSLWQWQYPNPQGNILYDVDAMVPSMAIAVGDLGAVVKTVDGGEAWSVSPTIAGLPSLRGVSFVSATTIVAVGLHGVVVRSVDGGENWSPQVSGTTDALHDVDFTDALHGTAVGQNGLILRSDNGGMTWTEQPVERLSSPQGVSETLLGVSMVDPNTAFAVGGGGTILKTIDGANWTVLTSGTTVPLFGVDFINANLGTAVGEGPTALTTTDGGTSWSPATWLPDPVPSFPTVQLQSVDRTDASNGYTVGLYDLNDFFVLELTAILARTTDSGVVWNWDTEPTHLYGVAMFNNSEGVTVGGAGMIRRTTDGGLSWPQAGGGFERYSMVGIDFFETQNGVAVSVDSRPFGVGSSRFYATNNGGTTWTVLQPLSGHDMFDVAFADASTVYACGNGPFIMDAGASIWRSTDGGMTWNQFFTTFCAPDGSGCDTYFQRAKAIDFADPNAGVTVGTEGGVVTILNGVATKIPAVTSKTLNGVSVPTSQAAYAVGVDGVILKGDPAAASWVPLNSGTTLPLNDVCFSDAMTGTAVGELGTILRTTDGGATWTPQASGTTASLVSVSFLDASNGIIGTGTTLLKTLNGGETWVPESTPSRLVDVVYIDPANVAAAGGHENIIARLDVPVPVFFQDLTAWVHPQLRSVELRWAVHADEAIRGFRVYRNDGHGGGVEAVTRWIAPTDRAFIDHNVQSGATYTYTLAAVTVSGAEMLSRPVLVSLPRAPLTLFQNHPNPFNPTTRIRFALPEPMRVTLNVYDIAGRRITTLVDGVQPSGEHEVNWNGKNNAGTPVGSGIYIYELRTPDRLEARKMMLLK